ncbi:hypothetical protein BH10PAT1_BH10PAT1_7360 [soil metagenome]
MKFKITSNKLTGSPDHSGWVYIHDFTPANNEMLESKGRIFALISMLPQNGSALPDNQSSIVSAEILTRFQEIYYNEVGNPFDLLQKSVEIIHKNFTSPNESLQILVGAFLGNKIILVSFGKVEAWVKRNNNLAKLINSSESLVTSVGFFQNDDEFFLGTNSFFEKITPEVLKTNDILSSITSPESSLGIISLRTEILNDVNVPALPVPKEINPQPIVNQLPKTISPIRIAAASLIDKILLILPSQRGFVKEDLVNPENSNKKKIATTAGIILLILLVVSILFGKRQQNISNIKSQYEPTLTSAEHNLEEAESLSSVNATEARKLILNAKSQIDGLKAQNIKDTRITDLSNKIDSDLGNIAGIYEETASLYLDLTLLNNNFKGDDIAASDDRMVVLDKAGKRLESIVISSSHAEPVAGPDTMPNAINVAAYSDSNFVSTDNGIWSIGDKAYPIIPGDKDLGPNLLISAYTGNFYILDKNNSAVWRYQGDGGVFGTKSNWFGAGIKPDLSSVISWTFDGSIWMLTSDSQILRFSGGSPIDFSLTNMDKDPVAIDIFTTQDSKYLYILDKGNGRVLVVSKDDGSYVCQYLDNSVKNATKLVVSETDKKIILLEGNKLFSLDLKHL